MATRLPLGNGIFALIDEEDAPIVGRFNWRVVRASGGRMYAVARVWLHRLVLDPAPDLLVDHINGDGLDNRKCNLRTATNSQNQANTGPRGGSSRFKGVSWNRRKRKWAASFMASGQLHFVGYFDHEDAAARAVDRRRLEVSGEFAVLNFPPEE